MPKRKAKKDRAWDVGYACACAEIIRTHDQPTIAEDVYESNFLTVSQLRAAGVDEYDIKVLKPIIREIERKRNP